MSAFAFYNFFAFALGKANLVIARAKKDRLRSKFPSVCFCFLHTIYILCKVEGDAYIMYCPTASHHKTPWAYATRTGVRGNHVIRNLLSCPASQASERSHQSPTGSQASKSSCVARNVGGQSRIVPCAAFYLWTATPYHGMYVCTSTFKHNVSCSKSFYALPLAGHYWGGISYIQKLQPLSAFACSSYCYDTNFGLDALLFPKTCGSIIPWRGCPSQIFL